MSYLKKTSVTQLQTLFNLFPIKALKTEWNDAKGVKMDVAFEIAGNRDTKKYSEFIHKNINICKQHIYIFETDIDDESLIKMDFEGNDQLAYSAEDGALKITYLAKLNIDLIVTDPIQKVAAEFFIPYQIEIIEKYLIVKFVKFEKNFKVEGIDSSKIIIRKHNHEDEILTKISRAFLDNKFRLFPADLHKGIKHLWDKDLIDGFVVSYKGEKSVDTTKMDDRRGVKKYNTKVYEENIRDAQLFGCLFETIVEEGKKPVVFTGDSTKGFLSFNKYSEDGEESENVVKEIIKHNK